MSIANDGENTANQTINKPEENQNNDLNEHEANDTETDVQTNTDAQAEEEYQANVKKKQEKMKDAINSVFNNDTKEESSDTNNNDTTSNDTHSTNSGEMDNSDASKTKQEPFLFSLLSPEEQETYLDTKERIDYDLKNAEQECLNELEKDPEYKKANATCAKAGLVAATAITICTVFPVLMPALAILLPIVTSVMIYNGLKAAKKEQKIRDKFQTKQQGIKLSYLDKISNPKIKRAVRNYIDNYQAQRLGGYINKKKAERKEAVKKVKDAKKKANDKLKETDGKNKTTDKKKEQNKTKDKTKDNNKNIENEKSNTKQNKNDVNNTKENTKEKDEKADIKQNQDKKIQNNENNEKDTTKEKTENINTTKTDKNIDINKGENNNQPKKEIEKPYYLSKEEARKKGPLTEQELKRRRELGTKGTTEMSLQEQAEFFNLNQRNIVNTPEIETNNENKNEKKSDHIAIVNSEKLSEFKKNDNININGNNKNKETAIKNAIKEQISKNKPKVNSHKAKTNIEKMLNNKKENNNINKSSKKIIELKNSVTILNINTFDKINAYRKEKENNFNITGIAENGGVINSGVNKSNQKARQSNYKDY